MGEGRKAMEDLLERFVKALNARDIDAVMDFVNDDIVFESAFPAPDGARYDGRAAVRHAWNEFLVSSPNLRFDVEEQFADGVDRAVVRWRLDSGDEYIRGVDILRLRDGKIAESMVYVKG